jgi:hypothetical protein
MKTPTRLLFIAPFVPLLLYWGCAAPPFAKEGEFARPLTEFHRIEARTLSLSPLKIEGPPECRSRAEAFSRDYRRAITYRLHRKKILDAPEGPLLVVEGELLRYAAATQPGSPENVSATVEVRFIFKDEAGSRLGSGRVSATQHDLNLRAAIDAAEKQVIASLYKFIRKGVTGKVEPEKTEPEPPPAEVVP